MTDHLTLWRTFVQTISTGALPFHLEVRPSRSGDGLADLVVTLGVVDFVTGRQTQTGVSETLPSFPYCDLPNMHPDVVARAAEKIVYEVVQRVWLHELREHWTVGRCRVRDPHAGCGDGVGIPLTESRDFLDSGEA